MSKGGKILILFGALFYAGLYIFRIAYTGWHESMWVPLVLGTLLFFGGLIKERRALVDFFTMRTTREGLNMGAILVLALVGLTCLNILAVRYDVKFDWTSEKLNSLSDQSVKAARAIQGEATFVLLYRTEQQNGESVRTAIKNLVEKYQNVNRDLRFQSIDALLDPAAVQKYDYTSGPFALFLVQGDRKLRIDQTNESGVTGALVKLSHPGKKVIYFTLGHGERDLDSRESDGLFALKEELSSNYDVRTLTLYQSGNKVPGDAAAVAIVRPTQQFLETEIQALRDYVQSSNGRLLMALDPGLRQNLANLTKTFGIEYQNNFLVTYPPVVERASPATVIGSMFPDPNDITKSFTEGSIVIFDIASSLKKAPDAPASAKISSLVSTGQRTMATYQLGQVEFKPNGPHVVGMTSSSGKSEVIVFGDSDFFTNRFILNNLNKDLILNSLSDLTDDKDLISIRPRLPEASRLEMTRQSYSLYVLLFLLPLPPLLFFLGGFMWWRRRKA